jgi:hypothetical protein
MTDLECFVHLVSEKLSPVAKTLIHRAGERHRRYSALLDGALIQAFKAKALLEGIGTGKRTPAQIEAAIIKKIIDFEVKSHKKKPEWTFRSGGLARLSDDFALLNEYISSSQSQQFKKLCERWGHFALTLEERDELKKIEDETKRTAARLEKVRPQFQPLWSFFVALCHALQEGEDNYLTALDAYWLGLIDEVVGEGLDSPRFLAEFHPDAPVAKPETA